MNQRYDLSKFRHAWDKAYGDHRDVLATLTNTIYKNKEDRLAAHLKSSSDWMIDRTALRYYGLKHLIEEGIVSGKKLDGLILDIGCHLGSSVDALAMFGGKVKGVDCGDFGIASPSGIMLGVAEGIYFVDSHRNSNPKPSTITCYNADWVESMSSKGWRNRFYEASLGALSRGGQIIMTFQHEQKIPADLKSKVYMLPSHLSRMDNYAVIGTK